MIEPIKIISDGQTGVGRAALDVAFELGLHRSGWCPKGRLAEDGVISTKYPLFQTPSADDQATMERNVRDSNATLVLSLGKPAGGTSATIETALKQGRPCLVVDLAVPVNARSIRQWITAQKIQSLHVAGPAVSEHAEMYHLAAQFLRQVFEED